MKQPVITQRLEVELEQLADEVRALDQFDESTTLNIHALSCLMRYAAWHDPASFLAWLRSKKFTINPNIIDRIELYTNLSSQEGGERDGMDGIELRIHIFRNSNETFKHSHKQDFITLCLQGAYRYRYFQPRPSSNPDDTYEVYCRHAGQQRLIEQRAGVIQEVCYVGGEALPHEGGSLFHEDSPPLFVDAQAIHTVEHVSDEPVITFVVRRGLCRAETVVLRAPGDEDPRAQNDAPPQPATDEERERVCLDLLHALTEGGRSKRLGASWSDIKAYQSPAHKVLTLTAQPLSEEREALLARLMVANGIYSIPVLNAQGECVELLSIPMVRAQDRDQPQRPLDRQLEPMVAYTHEPLLYALLAMIINESLMIPLVDQQERYCGVLSVDDILEAREPLGKALFWSLYESGDEVGVLHVRGLLSALERLKATCLTATDKPTRRAHDALVHEALTHLDELLLLTPARDIGRQNSDEALESFNAALNTVGLAMPISVYPLQEALLCPLEGVAPDDLTWLCELLAPQAPNGVVFAEGGAYQRLGADGTRADVELTPQAQSMREVLLELSQREEVLIAPVMKGAPPRVCDLKALNTPHLTQALFKELYASLPTGAAPAQLTALSAAYLQGGRLQAHELRSLLQLWGALRQA